MAKEKLIPEPPDTDSTGPRAKFREMASKVFSVPKAEIDKREKDWQRQRPIRSDMSRLRAMNASPPIHRQGAKR